MTDLMIFCILMTIPMFGFIFNLVPVIYVSLYSKNKGWNHRSNDLSKIGRGIIMMPFGDRLHRRVSERLHIAGIGSENSWVSWCSIIIILPIMILIFLLFSEHNVLFSICVSLGCFAIPEMWLNMKIEKRRNVFSKNLYKIYSFLHTQIQSGIKPTDAIKGIYEIADHRLIQDTFIEFTAQYELTLDIDNALEIIRSSFRGNDGEMLCVCIKQCIDTGMAGKTLLKMEEVMFSKYYNIIQKETEKYRTKLLISGLAALVPLILILCMPMIYEAMTGIIQMLS